VRVNRSGQPVVIEVLVLERPRGEVHGLHHASEEERNMINGNPKKTCTSHRL
jgi:hypothetical protein